MATLILVLGDQLTPSLPVLSQADKANDRVLLAEVKEEATYVKHHKKKIAFLFSAMRHFAKQLTEHGFGVTYIKYDSAENKGSLLEQIKHTLAKGSFDHVKVTMPGEYRLYKSMQQW